MVLSGAYCREPRTRLVRQSEKYESQPSNSASCRHISHATPLALEALNHARVRFSVNAEKV
eukprot:776987-Pleurochrysis_carterae.AAC.3